MRPRSFTSSFRSRGGALGGVTRQRLWAIAIGAVMVLYWIGLVRMGVWAPAASPIAPQHERAAERAPFVDGAILQAAEGKREAAEVVESAAEAFGDQGSNLRRDAERFNPTRAVEAQAATVTQRPTETVQPLISSVTPTGSEEKRSKAPVQTRIRSVAPSATLSATVPRVDKATSAPTQPIVPFDQRHVTLSGYDETLEYLANYKTAPGSDEELFLFFVCSDEQGRAFDWRRLCADAKARVYDVFAKAPSSKRLVTVYAGTKKDWTTKNPFYDDTDLRVKAVPSIMKWKGGAPGAKRATSGMMIEETLLYDQLLRFLFGNTDKVDPLLAHKDVGTKEIVTLRGYAEYSAYMERYNADPAAEPMFLMLISGRIAGNDRPWCPYCRYSELPVEYAFYAYAPRGARLVLVETFPSYGQWKQKDNDFKRDTTLNVRGTPAFYRVYPRPGAAQARYQRVVESFDLLEPLQRAFQGIG